MSMTLKIRSDIRAHGMAAAMRAGPVAGQVEVTSTCFQKCRGCESWRDDADGSWKGAFSIEDIKRLSTQLARQPDFRHLALTGGDPQDWSPLLDYIDWWHETCRKEFELQVNSALVKPVTGVWAQLSQVRASLDAVNKHVYMKMRGDKATDPAAVLERIDALGAMGVAVSTNTVVMKENLEQITPIIEACSKLAHPPVKMSFLPVLGQRIDTHPDVWMRYRGAADYYSVVGSDIPLSFSEDVLRIRAWAGSEVAEQVPCYTAGYTFHVKATGEVFPCCLVGGEAIDTIPDMALGNCKDRHITQILAGYTPQKYYKKQVCKDVCQYKQATLNLAAHEALAKPLAMP